MAQRSTKRTDGRMVRTVTDPRTGKRKYFYGTSEREINKKIMEYTTAMEIGRSFKEVAEEWWEDASPNLARQTIKVYKPSLARVIETFGDISIKEIKPREISRFLQMLAKKDLAHKTVMTHRTIINQIYDHAVVEGDVEINPCASVQTPKNLKSEKRSAATAEEEQIVREHRNLWAFPYIALMTGMRRGEILALQWRDIDFDNNIINVTKSAEFIGNQATIKSPKTEAGIRMVPLLDELKDFLLEQPDRKPENYVISDDGKNPLGHRRYQTLYKNFAEETGITCTAHQLRHSFATTAFESGVDAKAIQEIIGHKQLSTTMDRYTDFRKKSLEIAAEKLNKLAPKKP